MGWRGPGYQGPAPPEPWPGRHDAFLCACAEFAGLRERELLSVIEALGKSGQPQDPPVKPTNPLRLR